MVVNGTIRVELDIPERIYKALEYICSIPPQEDIKKYLLRTITQDVEGVADSGWCHVVDHLNTEMKKILEA